MEKPVKGNAIARVGMKQLYFEDMKDFIPQNLSEKDSIAFMKNYIDKWIREQVILEKAKMTLSDKQKDVTEQLEQYKNALLINKFEQSLISKQLDTNITEEEMQAFYDKHKGEMKLRENIILPLFIRLPKNTPNLAGVKIWCHSDKEADIDRLVKLAFKLNGEFIYEDNGWYVFREFFKKIPVDISPSEEQFLRTNHFIEFKDSTDQYFLNIKNYKLKNDIPPYAFETQEIKNIILNKRKITLITDLENRLFIDAVSEKHAEVYAPEIKNFKDTLVKKDSIKNKNVK
jgi:hypothetical protein